MLTKKAEAALKQYVKSTDPRDLARGRIIGADPDAHPGPFRLLPVLGWLRPQEKYLFLALSTIMLRVYDDRHMGTLGWSIPITERTERKVCGLLTSFGWDGRIWPQDPGWPDDAPTELAGLQPLLRDARLISTFVFPPEVQGSRVLRVDVSKISTDFPLPYECPSADYEEPTEQQWDKFKALCQDPSMFVPDPNTKTVKPQRRLTKTV